MPHSWLDVIICSFISINFCRLLLWHTFLWPIMWSCDISWWVGHCKFPKGLTINCFLTINCLANCFVQANRANSPSQLYKESSSVVASVKLPLGRGERNVLWGKHTIAAWLGRSQHARGPFGWLNSYNFRTPEVWHGTVDLLMMNRKPHHAGRFDGSWFVPVHEKSLAPSPSEGAFPDNMIHCPPLPAPVTTILSIQWQINIIHNELSTWLT